MRLKLILVIFALSALGGSAYAHFLPDNDLWKEDQIQGLDGTVNMTEAEFNQIIDKVYNTLEPSVALHGGTLVVNRKWDDPTVNANSEQHGKQWVVNMYGGLARRPEITHDGFALVMCHEMGHHLGGYPYYPFLGRWAAAEGQADYFATEVCAKKVFGADKVDNAKFREDATKTVMNKCDGIYKDPDQQNLCYRIAAAGQSLGIMLATLEKQTNVDYDHNDSSTVGVTNPSYPKLAQCRLDTYMAGLLCTAPFDLKVIPGRKQFGIQGTIADEKAASPYACLKSTGYQVGERPSCWYKDRLSN